MSIWAGRLLPVPTSLNIDKRRQLAVAQVVFGVGAQHAFAQGHGIPPAGPNVLALFAHDDGGAGVLAHGQHATCCDVGVFQQFQRHEAVVGGSLSITENRRQLLEVRRAQQVRGVAHRGRGQQAQAFGFDFQDGAPSHIVGRDMVAGQQPVFGLIGTEGEKFVKGRLANRFAHEKKSLNWGG